MSNAAFDLHPAGRAFDAVAEIFDARFDPWLSVQAQRGAVREVLLRRFPAGGRVLEIGGGTGTDAAWLTARGRSVHLTDASPAMVAVAARKLGPAAAEVLAAENVGAVADRLPMFDGAFSNFAALNCVSDLRPVGKGLARLVRPGGHAILVVFGCFCPGEMVTQAARGHFANMVRRFKRGDVSARLSGREFTVRYHRRGDMEQAMAPWFRLVQRKGIGVFVPPSSAEPWISRHPGLLGLMERIDRVAGPMAPSLGDHIVYDFERIADAGAPA